MTVVTEKTDGACQNGGGNAASNGDMKADTSALQHVYTIPGILHYLQHEWTKFEVERSRWEVEKLELEAKIAFLQGERKGQENLKNDLVRRIKMLEYALCQERAQLYRLKYGCELGVGEQQQQEDEESGSDTEQLVAANCAVSWRQGRQLLRQYLAEIGYTDTVINVRSNRVRVLLGLQQASEPGDTGLLSGGCLSGAPSSLTPAVQSTSATACPPATVKPSAGPKCGLVADDMLKEAERDVMANFDFLQDVKVEVDDTDDEDDLSGEEINTRQQNSAVDSCHQMDGDEMAAALKSLSAEPGAARAWTSSPASVASVQSQPDSAKMRLATSFALAGVETGLEAASLGELAKLSVSGESGDQCYDSVSGAGRASAAKLWTTKYTLRSHFDGIRSVVFHPIEPVLVTASEDHTMKLWNLTRTIPAKKSAFLDVEPIYTFRGHDGAVLCVGMNPTGEQCYSGGQDGTVRVWTLPHSATDPYDSYDPVVLHQTLTGHTDAVWALALHAHRTQLLSCSADGTVRLWRPDSKTPLLQTYEAGAARGAPTSVDFVRGDCVQMVVSYTGGDVALYDVETAQPVLWLERPPADSQRCQANCVVTHPTTSLTMAAHEDCHLRFYDNVSGSLVHHMVAHQDAVTSLAVDPNGLYLLSASHDCSVRLWNLDTKHCVQEITAHRKKWDESIHCVAFHPTKAFIASAGADAIAKVFV